MTADMLSAEEIKKYLTAAKCSIEVYDEVTSTNTLLKELGSSGAEEGKIIFAASQTEGRGRHGRSFYSPRNSGIYMSILVRPQLTAEKASLLTAMTAVAVCRAVEEICGVAVGIKWVNDIFVNERKVCGILTEAVFDKEGGLEYCVVGIGINLYDNGFPRELEGIAGGILKNTEGSTINRLAAAVCNKFFEMYSPERLDGFIEEYQKRSILTGKSVMVIRGSEAREATAGMLDERCRLCVTYTDGGTEYLSAGEVSIKIG